MAATIGAGFVLRASETEAANANVSALATNRFSPNAVTIGVGDSVMFTLGGGGHVVDLENVFPDIPLNGTNASGSAGPFMTAGTYYYYCSIHANSSLATEAHVQANDAMVGKIVVTAAATPSATATTAVPATTAPRTGQPTTTVAPAPPRTGTGMDSGNGMEWDLFIMLGAPGVALASAAALALRQR